MRTCRSFCRRESVLKSGDGPVKPSQAQHAFDHACGLAQCRTKEAFDGETELDGSIGESGLPSASTGGRSLPVHILVEPEKEQSSLLEGVVVGLPVDSLVLGRKGLAHAV